MTKSFSLNLLILFALATLNTYPICKVETKQSIMINDLIDAIKDNKTEVAKKLIENNEVNIHSKTSILKNTALIEAVSKGNLELVKLLIRHGANINETNVFGCSALSYAINMEFSEIASTLINNGADVNVGSINFFKVISHQQIPILSMQGPNAQRAALNNEPVLITAVMRGISSEIIELLLANGAEVDATNHSGATALIFAVQNGYTEIIKLLLKYGANVNAKDYIGRTPLSCAVTLKRMKIMELLLKNGADINLKPLDFDGDLKILKLLLEYGAEISPIHITKESKQTFKEHQQKIHKIISDVALPPDLANICTEYIIELPKE